MPRSSAALPSSARNVAGLALGLGALLWSAARAREGLTDDEVDIFRFANGLPEGAYRAVWAPMQYGTFAVVPAASTIAIARRRPGLAWAIGIGGTAAWLAAKAVKPLVARGRPALVLDDVVLRGTDEGDLGFPSGHAAVSAALTFVLWPYLSRGWRVGLVALSGFVPIARMYVGVHLPLDVVGGSALGVAIGSAVGLVVPAETSARSDDPDGISARRTARSRPGRAARRSARRGPRRTPDTTPRR
jgi:membrane-associated phospholipid phosphatase